jgi:hypothetical protein
LWSRSRGRTLASNPQDPSSSVGLVCSSPARRINKLTVFSCYYFSDFSPLGISIPLLRDLGNRFWSTCPVVQVGSCVMLETKKKSIASRTSHINLLKHRYGTSTTLRTTFSNHTLIMKLIDCSLLLASLSAIGLASISLEPMPSPLHAGDTHELSWTTDRDYVSNCETLNVMVTSY